MVNREDSRPPAAHLLGRKVESFNESDRTATLSFEAVEAFTNRHGTVQGGFLAAMLDSAAANAVLPALPADTTAVTTRLDTRFRSPARVGTIKASSRVVEATDKSALVEAQLSDLEGVVVASASIEFRLLRRR